MEFKSFQLDTFQEDAVKSIDLHRSVIVSAPTGSGKTLIADYIIDKSIKENKRVIYTAPIKALSNQKYKDFVADHGEDKIGLVTGDVVINSSAQILIMTTEVYRNMAVIKDILLDSVSYCVMDEIHFISDEERGYVWEESIIFSPENIRFLFLSATIPNADEFAMWVEKIKKKPVDVIKYHIRPVPLEIKFYDAELGITSLEKIKKQKELDFMPKYKGMYSKKTRRERPKRPSFSGLIKELGLNSMPCIYFVFSRAKTRDYAEKLSFSSNYLSQNEKNEVMAVLDKQSKKLSPDVLSLDSTVILKNCLVKGIAFHHAGILPDLKHVVELLFSRGLIKVLFATETFAVGINMPAKTVCFDGLRKYTSTGFRYVNSKEFFQISGRAGRRGMDKFGLSVSLVDRENADFKAIREITTADNVPLTSQFKMSYNTILNMVNLHTEEEIEKILKMNYYTFQLTHESSSKISVIKKEYEKKLRLLETLGYIENSRLTEMGRFTSKIYSNELEISQLFHSDFKLDEYTILLLVAALAYEEKRDFKFNRLYHSKALSDLINSIRNHKYLRHGNFWKNLNNMSAIVHPCMEQKSFIEILGNTNLQEGDLLRIFMQMLDKLEQIDRAIQDPELMPIVRNCKYILKDSLKGIGMF